MSSVGAAEVAARGLYGKPGERAAATAQLSTGDTVCEVDQRLIAVSSSKYWSWRGSCALSSRRSSRGRIAASSGWPRWCAWWAASPATTSSPSWPSVDPRCHGGRGQVPSQSQLAQEPYEGQAHEGGGIRLVRRVSSPIERRMSPSRALLASPPFSFFGGEETHPSPEMNADGGCNGTASSRGPRRHRRLRSRSHRFLDTGQDQVTGAW